MKNNIDVCVICGNYVVEGEGMVCLECQNNPHLSNYTLKNIHINNSYKVWHPDMMWGIITSKCYDNYKTLLADRILNRNYTGMYIEWYLHNIGYWITLPFIKNKKIQVLNERFKHVDLEEHRKKYIKKK